ncbi:hypothetical protein EHM69_04785 [candidate division KSB1 bacterium]|nr:MAG: hypothetical protein EHM69_04785 [candidate division KSB1 bacterium]
MSTKPKFPSWLIFVDRAPDDTSFLRLMVLNPENDAVSTFVNYVVETDPEGYAPQASDLHTSAQPRP